MKRTYYIEYTMGRTGKLTPVAVFEPIDIDGTIVERASLHNISVMMETLGQAYKGQLIKIFKANQIIPQVSWAEKKELTISDFRCETCPVCGGRTELNNNDGVVTLYCTNPQCQGKLINRLDHFCGKNGLDIKGLSKATLEKLIDLGWISSFVDIYKLKEHQDEWKSQAGFGEKSVERILEAIDSSKNPTLDMVIAAAGIPLIGRAVAKDLCKYIDTYEDFRYKIESGFDFTTYDGFGGTMDAELHNFNYKELDDVVDYALNIKEKGQNNQTQSCEGITFCVTGKVHIYKNRDEIKSVIESLGGKVVSSMSSKVQYLINNDITSTSSKNTTAKQMNIPIITEEQFQDMFL